MDSPRERVFEIIEENRKLRERYHEIGKQIIDMAENAIYPCVSDLIQELSSSYLPEHIQPIWNCSGLAGCCVEPSKEWKPAIACYKYKNLESGNMVDLYFVEEDGGEEVDDSVVEAIRSLCSRLSEEVGIQFYVWGKHMRED